MSIDYALWQWKELPPRITAGLCYLLLAEGMDCPEAAPLDVERLEAQIAAADWSGADAAAAQQAIHLFDPPPIDVTD